MKEFLDDVYKIWVGIFAGIGFIFIFNLWWQGMDVGSAGGGGFISISIGWAFEYFWISASYIALVLFIFSLGLIYLIKLTPKANTKVLIALFILIIGISGKQIFYTVSPEYKFYKASAYKLYLDKDGTVNDVDKYLDLVGQYCQDVKYYQIGSCNGKYSGKFKSVEDYIKVFDYANKINDNYMYYNAFEGVKEKYLLTDALNNYDNLHFKLYILKYNIFTLTELENIKIFMNSDVLKNVYMLEKDVIQKLGDSYENKNDSFWNEEYTNKFNKILKENNINF